MRHPFYALFSAASCVFLFLANHNGYSLLTKAFSSRGSGAGAHSSGYYHK